MFERAVLDLPGSKVIDVRAPGAAADTQYVHSLQLDGRSWDRTYLPRTAVRDGARLDFTLGAEPDTTWATSDRAAPPSYRQGEQPFLVNTAPNQITIAPGGPAGTVSVDAQRLGGDDRTLDVSSTGPKGLDVTPTTAKLSLGSTSGSGSTALEVAAPKDTPEGFYELPVTVRGRKGATVKRTAIVQVAAEHGFEASYNATGISSDTDAAQADFDRSGNSYSRDALAAAGLKPGAQVEVSGTTLDWPASPPGRPDHLYAAGQTVDLTKRAQAADRMVFVGSAIYGDVRSTATVTFTDGSTQTTDLSFGDWVLPGGGSTPVFDNTVVAHPEYRNQLGGRGGPAYVYATKPFQVPDGKRIASVTLPDQVNLHLFGIGLG
jgi:hypothetical protein